MMLSPAMSFLGNKDINSYRNIYTAIDSYGLGLRSVTLPCTLVSEFVLASSKVITVMAD